MPKKIIKYLIGFIILALTTIILINIKVVNFSKPYLYHDVSATPKNYVGIVLGTSKYKVKGGINSFFQYRINAAVELYKQGKIKKILVSGDNSTKSYNEPEMMRASLIKKGIPSKDIVLDYAGFRTFDSMIRSKEVFNQHKFTIISQKFHNERAVFIAQKYGMDAVGFNAQSPNEKYTFKTRYREYLARVKMFLDIYILNTRPKYLGKKENI